MGWESFSYDLGMDEDMKGMFRVEPGRIEDVE
jgi:hypothetical protein